MRLRLFQAPLLGAALMFLGLSPLACAQQTSGDLTEQSLEDLMNIQVYSASKHLENASDASSSVTVITADEIQKYGYRTLTDILDSIRSFYITSDRNYSYVGVRGFGRLGDSNHRILLMVDGHRLNDNVFGDARLGTEFPVDEDLIERVEIVRGGPQRDPIRPRAGKASRYLGQSLQPSRQEILRSEPPRRY
jgi:outer membrane receptor for ferrienterochelin and colicin